MTTLPKNEDELNAFFKLLEIFESQKLVYAVLWDAGTKELYDIRVNRVKELKNEYFKMVANL